MQNADKRLCDDTFSQPIEKTSAAQPLQQVRALAQRGDELRVEKVKRIRKEIMQGVYYVEAAEVAKAILRGEISRLLNQKPRIS